MPGFHSGKDIQKMIQKYVDGTATAEEIIFVEAYYAYQDSNEVPELSEQEQETLGKQTLNAITAELNKSPQFPKRTSKLLRYAVAAAVLAVSATSGYLFLKGRSVNHRLLAAASKKQIDVKPGTNRAVLTLADGSSIILDDQLPGNIKQLPGLMITKTPKGELIYKVSAHSGSGSDISTNTITTPKGGQYQVFLADGTHVWLNAASKLTFPQAFVGRMRRVKLEGEGYFEVTRNKAMPFHVLTGSQDVEVTGTHFNVNGYTDSETINTTLLEGGITVHQNGRSKQVSPGQQAIVSVNLSDIKVNIADTEEAVAWKNGLFEFNNASLTQIMNQLERWYDLKIDYSSLPAKRYNGMVPRSANLSRVLQMLEVTGNIKFKIEEQRHLRVISR